MSYMKQLWIEDSRTGRFSRWQKPENRAETIWICNQCGKAFNDCDCKDMESVNRKSAWPGYF